MNFVLDNSVAMRWLLGGNSNEIAYASLVLDAFKVAKAVVPGLWFLEASNVIAKAERGHPPPTSACGCRLRGKEGAFTTVAIGKHGVTEARSQVFISTLGRLNIDTDKMTALHALGDTLNLARLLTNGPGLPGGVITANPCTLQHQPPPKTPDTLTGTRLVGFSLGVANPSA